MNSVIEKEKKLNLALTKLKNLNFENPDIKKNIENLDKQKIRGITKSGDVRRKKKNRIYRKN